MKPNVFTLVVVLGVGLAVAACGHGTSCCVETMPDMVMCAPGTTCNSTILVPTPQRHAQLPAGPALAKEVSH
jgi:hypothetical protein